MAVLGDAFTWLTDSASYSGSFGIPARIVEHVLISFQSAGLAAICAIPVGLYIGHTGRLEFLAVSIGNLGRALPSFGIIGFLFPFTILWPGKFGYWPTFIAMFLLAIPPILTSTVVGIKGVDRDTVEAARGMGMTERDVLFKLELPLATPLLVAGLRTAAVQVVATATLWAVAGGGGLGRFILDGMATGRDDRLLGGAILVALLAFATELLFGVIERVTAPRLSSSARRRVGRAFRPETQPAP
jgi:osmoprotectant transport system permease protein